MDPLPPDSRTGTSQDQPVETRTDRHGAGVYPYCAGTGRRTVRAFGEEIGTFPCEGCDSPGCPARLEPDRPKRIEPGHVVVNTRTRDAGRVRELLAHSVIVEVRLGDKVRWPRVDVVLVTEWEAREDARRRFSAAGVLEDATRARELFGLPGPEPHFTGRGLGPISTILLRPMGAKVDRRLRTSPHGDALSTRLHTPYPQIFLSSSRWPLIFDELKDFRPHPAQRAFYDNPAGILGGKNAARRKVRSAPFWADDNEARLTPGALKLAGARVMARGGPDSNVAAAMANQIDFEWESRRWAEPPGDAEAAANGMGC